MTGAVVSTDVATGLQILCGSCAEINVAERKAGEFGFGSLFLYAASPSGVLQKMVCILQELSDLQYVLTVQH